MIGSGNVATHLSTQLHKAKHEIVQVYSRTRRHAQALAKKVNTRFTTQLRRIDTSADLYIVSISDDGVKDVVSKLTQFLPEKSRIAHTSGVLGLSVYPDHFRHGGIFYPLQTFTIGVDVDFSRVPLLIEGKSPALIKELKTLGKSISNRVVTGVSIEEKERLHLAAVFVNNFTNHMVHVAQQICEESKLDFELLRPLLLQTVEKLNHVNAGDAQTGPAIRGDKKTTHKHLKMLQDHPDWQRIYTVISNGINKVGS